MTIHVGSTGSGCLHVFDMDGTLLRGTATIELARQLGQLDTGHRIETLWSEGRITDTEFWRTLLEICQNASESDFDAAFHNATWMEGIAETFADIRSRGETVIVISQSPAFFVRRLQLWGAHETYGSAVEPGVPLSDTATLMPEAKVTITHAALAARNLGEDDCVVYGDSSSDVELFKSFSRTVGINPSPSLRALAATRYQGTNIREAYLMGRLLFGSADRHKSNQAIQKENRR